MIEKLYRKMNHITTESGKTIIACGAEGSHIRNQDEFDVTLPRLIGSINVDIEGCKIVDRNFMVEICREQNVPEEKIDGLIKTAFFYFDQQKTHASAGI